MASLPRPRRLVADRWQSASVFVAIATVTVLTNTSRIFRAAYETGDEAANALLIERARSARLLVGNYSRFHFNHPGPAFLYVEAIGERLFQFVPGTSTPLNRDAIAVIILNAAFLTATTRLLRRHEGLLATLLFWVGLCVLIRTTPGLLASTWMPHLYVAPFMLFVVALAVVLARRNATSALSISTAFLIHGHVSFALIAGLPFAIAVVARRHCIREWLQDRRTRRIVVATWVLFAAPLLITLITRGPSAWTVYLHSTDTMPYQPRTLGDSIRFVGHFWPFAEHASLAPLIVGAGAVFGGLALSRLRCTKRLSAWFVAAGLVLPLGLLYVHEAVDNLSFTYTGIFLGGLATVTTAVALANVLTRLRRVVAPGRALPPMTRSIGALGLAGIGALALAVGPSSRGVGPDADARWVPRAVKAVGSDTSVKLRLSFGDDAWPEGVAMLVALRRTGRQACVVDGHWAFMVTDELICRESTGPWLLLTKATPPSGGNTVFTSPSSVTFTRFP